MVLVRSSESISKPPVYRILGIQLAVCLLAGLGGLLLVGPVAAKSALIGGAIALVPNGYFAWRAFLYNGTRSAARAAGSLFQAEIGKLMFTAVLFAAAFKLGQPLSAGVLFAVFVTAVLAGIAASYLLLDPKGQRSR